ncbi:MAG: hypothetical protein V4490_04525 [Pseudomonadota bacterium]
MPLYGISGLLGALESTEKKDKIFGPFLGPYRGEAVRTENGKEVYRCGIKKMKTLRDQEQSIFLHLNELILSLNKVNGSTNGLIYSITYFFISHFVLYFNNLINRRYRSVEGLGGNNLSLEEMFPETSDEVAGEMGLALVEPFQRLHEALGYFRNKNAERLKESEKQQIDLFIAMTEAIQVNLDKVHTLRQTKFEPIYIIEPVYAIDFYENDPDNVSFSEISEKVKTYARHTLEDLKKYGASKDVVNCLSAFYSYNLSVLMTVCKDADIKIRQVTAPLGDEFEHVAAYQDVVDYISKTIEAISIYSRTGNEESLHFDHQGLDEKDAQVQKEVPNEERTAQGKAGKSWYLRILQAILTALKYIASPFVWGWNKVFGERKSAESVVNPNPKAEAVESGFNKQDAKVLGEALKKEKITLKQDKRPQTTSPKP